MNERTVGVIWLVVTVGAYLGARRLHIRRPCVWLMPIFVVPVFLIVSLLFLRVSFATYNQYSRWLMWLLGPATIAFALPIYQQRAIIRRYPVSILTGVISSVGLGLVSSWGLSRVFGLSPELTRCMLLRSISTPFALQAAGVTGASQGLTALLVMLTGVCGILMGEGVLFCIAPGSRLARGAMWGAAAHAIGTARAHQFHPEEGAISSLVMVFAGVSLVLMAPWIW
jgi:putative effector of murein hydrolase